MLSKNIETFIACDAEYEDAETVIFGAPFDSTTSNRPGTRFGSRAIRSESFGLETYSPYQDKDLEDIAAFDSGDLELCFGSSEQALADIEERAKTILEDGKRPFLIGGEHLVTLGAVRAVAAKYPDLHIIHFDAHADLRQEYLGAELSHACVLRRCWDILGDGRIFQFGIRSGDRSEFRWAQEGHVARNDEHGSQRSRQEPPARIMGTDERRQVHDELVLARLELNRIAGLRLGDRLRVDRAKATEHVRAARGVVLDRHLPDTAIYPDIRDTLDIRTQLYESIEVPLWHRTRQL